MAADLAPRHPGGFYFFSFCYKIIHDTLNTLYIVYIKEFFMYCTEDHPLTCSIFFPFLLFFPFFLFFSYSFFYLFLLRKWPTCARLSVWLEVHTVAWIFFRSSRAYMASRASRASRAFRSFLGGLFWFRAFIGLSFPTLSLKRSTICNTIVITFWNLMVL